jgi:ArsR family metal-binding transcriptional regulator
MGRVITTFPRRSEFTKAKQRLDALGLSYEVLSPGPVYLRVAAPAVVIEEEARSALFRGGATQFTCSGWVEYCPSDGRLPQEEPLAFEEDIFGEAAVMVLARCVADRARIRIIAHISGNLAGVFPYLNGEMPEACYNHKGPTFTFMDVYRMVSMYPRRIAVAKADGVVDAWRVLEGIRRRVNETWARRERIEPCYEMRERPPALEIYRRLPGLNCGRCGEKTCLAFAVSLWMGATRLSRCEPVFSGEQAGMKDALVEICSGLGVPESAGEPSTDQG